MIVKIDEQFVKDIGKQRNRALHKRIARMIENVRKASNIQSIKDFKKLKGYTQHYRLRIGDYRAGVLFDGNTITFVRFLHRKDIYGRFP